MKTSFQLLTVIFLLLVCSQTMAQTQGKKQPVSNVYEPRFEFRNASGEVRDTFLPVFMFKVWLRSASFPNYVHWKNQHFAVKKTQQREQFGLFTDSVTTFSAGDTVGYVYLKKPKLIGQFVADYVQTCILSVANNSANANVHFALAPRGVVLIASANITPLTEITFNTQELAALFPNDPTIKASLNARLK